MGWAVGRERAAEQLRDPSAGRAVAADSTGDTTQ